MRYSVWQLLAGSNITCIHCIHINRIITNFFGVQKRIILQCIALMLPFQFLCMKYNGVLCNKTRPLIRSTYWLGLLKRVALTELLAELHSDQESNVKPIFGEHKWELFWSFSLCFLHFLLFNSNLIPQPLAQSAAPGPGLSPPEALIYSPHGRHYHCTK